MSVRSPASFAVKLARLATPSRIFIRARPVWQIACNRATYASNTKTGNPHSNSNPRQSSQPQRQAPRTVTLLAAGGFVSLLFGLSLPSETTVLEEETDTNGPSSSQDDRDPKLPRFRLSEVRKHDAKSGSPWVTHEDKVYDITDWVGAHPGGDVILRAAGGSIDPYWNIFTIHKSPYVLEILDQYKIGFIDIADLVDGKPGAEAIEDPFADDPTRDPRLLTLTAKPRNAEPPASELTETFLTPNELFYVRNHMWVPVVEPNSQDHCLTIELLDGTVKSYSISDLRERFKSHKVTVALQCSGNRRADMTKYAAKTNGLQWKVGAISCAEWEGVKLADVLADAGFPVYEALSGNNEAKHVQFGGMEAYGASIPLLTAIDPRGDVLLAYGMNGKPLPRDHGFPLRAIVPGHVAARSVKWLSHISLSDEESSSQWQRRDYKCFGPNVGASPDWDSAPAIQEMPITSAITKVQLEEPTNTEKANGTPQSRAEIHGYAYSGGGREIVRVDISTDGGKTWDQAKLLSDYKTGQDGRKTWAWKRWVYKGAVPLTEPGEGTKKCTTLMVKATDEAYNSQPESYNAIYNVRGNLSTAWHKMQVCAECAKL
jgi:sulfite oxidase